MLYSLKWLMKGQKRDYLNYIPKLTSNQPLVSERDINLTIIFQIHFIDCIFGYNILID
jgi:hypothetical protein